MLVKAGKGRLIQVVTNLINNSIKFTKNGTILIMTKVINSDDHGDGSERKQIMVLVKDTGNGIDSEILPRLFSKFATNSEQGTGLDCIYRRRS